MSPAEKIAAAKALIEPLAGHTGAPWFQANDNEVHDRETFFGSSGERIGSTPMLLAEAYEPRAAENARLIAASPALRDTVADLIAIAAEQQAEIERLRALTDELDFLRHEVGPQSVAAMEAALKATIPVMRRTAAEYLESVMIRHNPDTIAPSEWEEIAPDLEAILAAEAAVGRLDDDDDRDRLWLNPILDAGQWRAVLGDAGQREGS